MNIQVLMHASHEGPGAITAWAAARGHDLRTFAVNERRLPSLDETDFLVVMGGFMNVYQETEHPWLAGEKAFIGEVIAAGRPVIGICLGAQLISVVLGGEVTGNKCKEIGLYPVELTEEAGELDLLDGFPSRFVAVHWHGDTFSIPEGCLRFARSEACENQAFAYDGGRVVGLQCHLEVTREVMELFVEKDAHELVPGKWIATPETLLAPAAPFAAANELLFQLLDRMVARLSPDH